MNDKITTIETLKKSVRTFVNERDWKQFHTPKNIAMALSVEAAELMELFLWIDSEKSDKQLKKHREAVEHEVADVAAYLLSLCAHYDIDLAQAFEKKQKLNALKYPVEKSHEITKQLTEL